MKQTAQTSLTINPRGVERCRVTLYPGRYELIRNLPGHYARGMYTELDVS